MVPKRSFASLKPGEKNNSDAASLSKKVDVKKVTEEAFDLRKFIDTAVDLAQPRPIETTEFNPTSPRLMAVFELLTNKSFPRKKGKGKSTKIVMLDAIIMAAINKKLILQEEKDAKSRGS